MTTHNVTPKEREAFALGMQETHLGTGRTYDNDPEAPESVAYDWGRNLGELPPSPWRDLLASAVELATPKEGNQ